MKKILTRISLFSGLAYLMLCAYLYFYQEQLLYFPKERLVNEAKHTLLFDTEVGTTVVTTEIRESGKALIYLGGNAEDVSKRLDTFRQTLPEHSLYLMHYRGYGGSAGSPREEALFKDAKTLYAQVRQQHSDVTVMGRSLGTGLATRLASEEDVQQLVLVTPYTSIEDLAGERYWGFPVSLLLKDKYLSWRYAPLVNAKTAIFLADQDKVIAPANTLKLQSFFKTELASLYRFASADHRSIVSQADFFTTLRKVLNYQE